MSKHVALILVVTETDARTDTHYWWLNNWENISRVSVYVLEENGTKASDIRIRKLAAVKGLYQNPIKIVPGRVTGWSTQGLMDVAPISRAALMKNSLQWLLEVCWIWYKYHLSNVRCVKVFE